MQNPELHRVWIRKMEERRAHQQQLLHILLLSSKQQSCKVGKDYPHIADGGKAERVACVRFPSERRQDSN